MRRRLKMLERGDSKMNFASDSNGTNLCRPLKSKSLQYSNRDVKPATTITHDYSKPAMRVVIISHHFSPSRFQIETTLSCVMIMLAI